MSITNAHRNIGCLLRFKAIMLTKNICSTNKKMVDDGTDVYRSFTRVYVVFRISDKPNISTVKMQVIFKNYFSLVSISLCNNKHFFFKLVTILQ